MRLQAKATLSTEAALARMAALCSISEHCESDIRQRLQRTSLTTSDIQAIIDRLYAEGFLDTARYCRAYASDQMRFSHWGPIKIAASLHQKGLPHHDIEAAIADLPDEEFHNILLQLLRAKRPHTLPQAEEEEWSHNPLKAERERLLRFAAQRGFSYEAAERALRCLEEEG